MRDIEADGWPDLAPAVEVLTRHGLIELEHDELAARALGRVTVEPIEGGYSVTEHPPDLAANVELMERRSAPPTPR